MRFNRAECARIIQNGETSRLCKPTKPKSRTRFTVQPAQPQKCPPTGPRDAKESKNGARAAIISGNSEERWASASQKLGFSRAANGRTNEQRFSVIYNHARRMCRVGRVQAVVQNVTARVARLAISSADVQGVQRVRAARSNASHLLCPGRVAGRHLPPV